MARYYQTTYDGLLKRLIAGGLIHADETKIELKGGEGYVWVFTNLEEVVFVYKPTREGGFLHELLRSSRASWSQTFSPPTTPCRALSRSASST